MDDSRSQAKTGPEATPSLRKRQKELTRALIFQALADIVTADGLHDLTIQQVADKAGVSHRTVYRYFANRDELLDAFAEWLDQTMQENARPMIANQAQDLPAAIVSNYAAFDAYAGLMAAYVRIYLTTNFRFRAREQRSQQFRNMIQAAVPNLDPEQITQAFTIIRYLTGSQSWYTLREQFDLDSEQAGAAVAWAVQCLLDDLGVFIDPGKNPTLRIHLVRASELP